MADPAHISEALADELDHYPTGMLDALRGVRGDGIPPADQPMLFAETDNDPGRFIGPPSRR